jgi:hypothetical protein
MAPGSTDLAEMLRTMQVAVREDEYVYALVEPGHAATCLAAATVSEDEGTTLVLRRQDADEAGLAYEFVAAWLTLSVHSALEAVGLTAAFSRALGDAGIPCNVLAGFHHDHVLVPIADTERALAALSALTGSADC